MHKYNRQIEVGGSNRFKGLIELAANFIFVSSMMGTGFILYAAFA